MPPNSPAVDGPPERVVMPLLEHEKELARLLAQRKKIDQRRDAVQAQITTLRKTVADIERANKAAEESSNPRPWQARLMRGQPATAVRDVEIFRKYLTTNATLTSMSQELGFSSRARVPQIVCQVARKLKPMFYDTGVDIPYPSYTCGEIRAHADFWIWALGRAEERHNVGIHRPRSDPVE